MTITIKELVDTAFACAKCGSSDWEVMGFHWAKAHRSQTQQLDVICKACDHQASISLLLEPAEVIVHGSQG